MAGASVGEPGVNEVNQLFDGLIVATAVVQEMTLVHDDPHIAAIPSQLLQQMKLPEK